MVVLDDLKFRKKILLPLTGMGAIFALVLGGGILQLVTQGKHSDHIIENVAPALNLLTEGDLQIQGLSYDIYRILSYQTGTQAENQAVASFNATAMTGAALFDQAAALTPDHAVAINSLKTRFDKIEAELKAQAQIAVTTNGFTLGSKDTAADLDLSASVARRQIAIDFETDQLTSDLVSFIKSVQAANVADAQSLKTNTQNAILLMVIAGISALLLGGGLSLWIVTAKVVAPLNALGERMKSLADGDLGTDIAGDNRRDEIGSMAKAVLVFKRNALKARQLEAEAQAARQQADAERERADAEAAKAARQLEFVVGSLADGLEKLSNGDLLFRLTAPFDTEYEKLRCDFNAAIDTLLATMKTIAANTQAVRAGAADISQASDDLSMRTEQTAANLEQTAAALDQITASVRGTAENLNDARSTVAAAKREAEHSGGIVRETVTAVTGIEESSKEIGNIVGLIDEIAFQTNLLALNAGVEAARAGDAGRGFAVVATEVRALAQRSADAARNIKTLVSKSSQQVGIGVRLVGQTGTALGHIIAQVERLNGLINDIAAAAKEQATGLVEVNSAVNQMDQATQQNVAMAEQSTAASNSLTGEAEVLANLISQFKLGHVTEIRAFQRSARQPVLPGPAPKMRVGARQTV